MRREVETLRRRMIKLEAAEREATVDEELFSIIVQTIPDIIYLLDSRGRFVFISDSVRQLGYEPSRLIGKNFGVMVHPHDLKAVSRLRVLRMCKGRATGDTGSPKLFDERRTGNRGTKNLEVRILLKNRGKESPGCCSAEIHSCGKWGEDPKTKKQKFLGSFGIIRDITERKRADEAKQLEKLSRALMECQEDERRRIAQELHDEVGQVLTAIKLTLWMIKKDHPELDGSIQQELEDAIQFTDRAMDDVRKMSVKLRPAMLDNLGLKECLQQEIESIKQLSGLEIEFTWEDMDHRLTPQKEIVLYRVAQEAVTNLIKYAGVTKANMSFRKKGDSVILRVQDAGNGFDIAGLANNKGMGILGMKERIDSVGGTLRISSRPGKGTVVEAKVTY